MPFLGVAWSFLSTKVFSGAWSVAARFIAIGLLIGVIVLVHQLDANYNYNKGWKVAYSQAITDHPPVTVGKGGTANIYSGPRMKCFPLHLGRFGFGFCHD